MNKISTTLACMVALGVLTITSCTKEKGNLGNENKTRQVAFTSGIDDRPSSSTRTTNGGKNWKVGDAVGIYMVTNGGSIPQNITGDASNVRYNVTDETTGALAPDLGSRPIEYPENKNGSVDFIAYYPYSTTNVNANGIYTVSLTDQSDPAAIDVMTAKTLNNPNVSVTPVKLSFSHALSKITINIRAGVGIEPADVEALESVVISSTPGSATIHLDGGEVTPGESVDIAMIKTEPTVAGYHTAFTVIVAPNSGTNRTVTVTMGEKKVVWSISDKEVFDSGKHGIFRGEITNSTFSIDGSTIEAWIDDNHEDELEKPEPELSNYRITWDATEKRYVLTNDPTDAGLYFKFGSVIGVFSGDDANQVLPGTNADAYDPTDVAWTPTVAVQVKEWGKIPYCKDPVNISAAYHTVANVKAGKGDPCRLVGLDLAKIKATGANTLTTADIDNGMWRLPTVSGNKMYTGRTSVIYNTAHWVSHDGTKTGVYGGAFLGGNMATFLPAAGMRSATGEVMNQNKQGYYRTSMLYTPLDSSSILYFNQSSISPDKDHGADNGLSVRCTRQ